MPMSLRNSWRVSVEISGSASHVCSRSGSSAPRRRPRSAPRRARCRTRRSARARDRARRARAPARRRRRCPGRGRSRAARSPRRPARRRPRSPQPSPGVLRASLRTAPSVACADTVASSLPPRQRIRPSVTPPPCGARRGSARPRGRAASPARRAVARASCVFASFTSPDQRSRRPRWNRTVARPGKLPRERAEPRERLGGPRLVEPADGGGDLRLDVRPAPRAPRRRRPARAESCRPSRCSATP